LNALSYNPAFDGLRAIAVSLVLGFHALVPRFSGGYLGVDVFFVLSGFLISSLLYREWNCSGQIKVRRFYFRRLVRLTPALFFLLITYIVLAPWMWPAVPRQAIFRDAAVAGLYLSDYGCAFWSVPVHLRHTWSLSVEEHFYLLWPWVLMILYTRFSRRQCAWALAGLYLLATAWRLYCDLDGAQGYVATYFRFDTRLSGLILGSWLATVDFSRFDWNRIPKDAMAFFALILVLICTWRFPIKSTLALALGTALVEWCTVLALMVINASDKSIAFSLLSARPLVLLGRLSYGIYLWHYPIFMFLWDQWRWYWILIIGGSITLLMATLSYLTVERWARQLCGLAQERPLLHAWEFKPISP